MGPLPAQDDGVGALGHGVQLVVHLRVPSDDEEAERSFRAAIDIAHRQKGEVARIGATVSLARLREGKPAEPTVTYDFQPAMSRSRSSVPANRAMTVLCLPSR